MEVAKVVGASARVSFDISEVNGEDTGKEDVRGLTICGACGIMNGRG